MGLRKSNGPRPYRFFNALLQLYCNSSIVEDIQGDLYELFYERLKEKGHFKAQLLFAFDVLHLMRPFAHYRNRSVYFNQIYAMNLWQNLRIAYRTLKKNSLVNGINILGLALGLASCFHLSFYIIDELSYDQFHLKKDRIYRVTTEIWSGNIYDEFAAVDGFVAPVALEEFPELENATRFYKYDGQAVATYNEKIFQIDHIYHSDPSVFDVFTYPLTKGNPESALEKPYSIVLSKMLSLKIFGSQEAMGEMVSVNGNSYLVTGILEDVPKQTDLYFDALLSFETEPDWDWWVNTYFLFREDASIEGFDDKLYEVARPYIADYNESLDDGLKVAFNLEALTEIHFHPGIFYDTPKSSFFQMYLLSAMAILVLIIAVINYLNLQLAQSSIRMKEIGVRKVIGASRWQLLGQFFLEALLSVGAVFSLALAFIWLTGDFMAELTGKSYSYQQHSFLTIAIAFIVLLIVGAISTVGFVGRFGIVNALRGTFNVGERKITNGQNFRRLMVALQFVISMGLLTFTFVVSDQMHFMQNYDLGFRKEQVLMVNIPSGGDTYSNISTLASTLKQHHQISDVSFVERNSLPGDYPDIDEFVIEGEIEDMFKGVEDIHVDHNFLDVLKINPVAGRNFSEDFANDRSEAVIVNEAFVKMMSWSSANKAIGQIVTSTYYQWLDAEIVGVIEDFHFQSLHQSTKPLILLYCDYEPQKMLIGINNGEQREVINFIESQWEEVMGKGSFNLSYFDEFYDRQYRHEKTVLSVFNVFSVLAIIIAGLGLFGLSSLTIIYRTKEVGIRKVMGAKGEDIMVLLSRDFVFLVLIAVVFAVPISWLVSNQWLQGFAYHITPDVWNFLLATCLVLMVALLTTGYHALKLNRTDPVESLKYE